MANIAVIGAGITGITTAYSLLEHGHAVTVIDRHRYPAMETSYANGGQLSASNAEVWNHWGTVFKGLAWLTSKDAPLALNPRPSWHKLSWLIEFLANIPNYRRHTIETTRLAIEARSHLFDIAAREGIEFDLETRGILHVYRDRQSYEHARSVNELLRKGGLDRHAVTPEEIRTLEPALPSGLLGGFYTESDATGDIHKFTRELARACERRGARLLMETTVTGLAASDHTTRLSLQQAPSGSEETFDRVVICAGVASRTLAAWAGDRVNIYPVKGYSITVNLNDEASRAAAPWTSVLDDRAKIVTSRLGNDRLRVAGTAELNGYNRDIRADRVTPLTAWTQTMFPGIDTSDVVPWAGLRPMLPNMMPRVGRGKRASVLYNTGHGHLGWTLSAATAPIVANLASEGLPPTPRVGLKRLGSRAPLGGTPRTAG